VAKRDTFHASAPREEATSASTARRKATSPVTALQRGKCPVTTVMAKVTCRESALRVAEEVAAAEVCTKPRYFLIQIFFIFCILLAGRGGPRGGGRGRGAPRGGGGFKIESGNNSFNNKKSFDDDE
jgi:hypothetical protein